MKRIPKRMQRVLGWTARIAKWGCIIALAAVLGITGWNAFQRHHADNVIQELHEKFETHQTETPESTSAADVPTEQEPAFPTFLQQENTDLAAWLTVPGTDVDYPVMLTPQDMEYYLHRDFYKKYASSGTPFFDTRCAPPMEADSLLIYGHNMRNGTMFTTLNRYENSSFGAEYPTLTLLLPEETRTYQLFAVLQINTATDSDLYGCAGQLTQEQFEGFVQAFRERAEYTTDVQPQYGDRLLVLSTCIYKTGKDRMLVVGCEKHAIE